MEIDQEQNTGNNQGVMKFTIPVPRAFPVHPSKNDEERLLA
jgi:hypothetical protein